MASSDTMKQVLGVFVLIVIALALTPAVGSFVTDAGYTEYTDTNTIDADVSNSTTLTYTPRNDSATFAYFTVTCDPANAYGDTTVDVANNMTYLSAKTVDWLGNTGLGGPWDDAEEYDLTITYYTEDLTNSVVLVLLPIVPILWITAVIAVGIVMITVLLRRSS
jgi:hypothetical protein